MISQDMTCFTGKKFVGLCEMNLRQEWGGLLSSLLNERYWLEGVEEKAFM